MLIWTQALRVVVARSSVKRAGGKRAGEAKDLCIVRCRPYVKWSNRYISLQAECFAFAMRMQSSRFVVHPAT